MNTPPVPPESEAETVPSRLGWQIPPGLHTAAYALVAIAAGWYMLVQLAPILRPLLTAVFLAYVLMPYHARLRRRFTAPVSLVLLAAVAAGAVTGLALAVHSSVVELEAELPQLEARAVAIARDTDQFLTHRAPWLLSRNGVQVRLEERIAEQAGEIARPVLSAAAGGVLEGCVVGLYLLFLLLEASRFPDRVRRAYPPERAEAVLHIAGKVNAAIISYLRAKVKSSLALAVPVGLVLWIGGVKFALLWAVLTFLCNFIPYVGTVVAYSLPVGFAFLQLAPGWEFVVVAVLLGVCHILVASVIEPMIIGKAVGLSPLVILGSLAFWGLLWGIPGMFLAVPLTVVAALVMKHFESTRALAQLLSD